MQNLVDAISILHKGTCQLNERVDYILQNMRPSQIIMNLLKNNSHGVCRDILSHYSRRKHKEHADQVGAFTQKDKRQASAISIQNSLHGVLAEASEW